MLDVLLKGQNGLLALNMIANPTGHVGKQILAMFSLIAVKRVH
jgi:hypothetical protein